MTRRALVSFFRLLGLLAGGLAVSLPAHAVAGLHQAVFDVTPEVQAMFRALGNLGEVALAVGLLVAILSGLPRRRGADRLAWQRLAWQRIAAVFWLFGAAAIFFAAIPAMQRASSVGWVAHGLPSSLLLVAVFVLFLVMRRKEGVNRHVDASPADSGFALVASGWIVLLVVLVAVPIACAWSLVWNRSGSGWGGLVAGLESLASARYWSLGCLAGGGACGSAVNSIVLGTVVATLAGTLGAALALFVHRAKASVRRSVAVLACLPMITPPFLVGFGLAQLFGKAGLVSAVLEALFGVTSTRWFFGAYGVAMAQILVFFPLAYFMALHALDSLGRSQIDAAKYLGASDAKVLRSVVFPVLRDPLAVAMLVIFVESLSDVGTPLLIGGKLRVLPSELFYSSSSELAANAMTGVPALLLVAIALAMTALKDYVARRPALPEMETASTEPGRCDLPRTLACLSGAALVATALLLVGIYAAVGVGAFSEGGKVFAPLTLDNFSRGFGFTLAGGFELTGSAWDSLLASLWCALLVAPVGGMAGIFMVWTLRRVGKSSARFVGNLSSYFFSVPSVVIGAGFMLAFGSLGLSDPGAWFMIVLAILIRNLAICLRFGDIAMSRLDRSQLEMSGLLGAGSITTFLRVATPTLRPVFVVCVAYGFIRSMTTLGSVLLLSSAQNQVATTFMIDRIGIGEFGVGMAYGVVLAGCIAAALLGGWLLMVAQRHLPGWGHVVADLKTAIVLAEKNGVRGVAG